MLNLARILAAALGAGAVLLALWSLSRVGLEPLAAIIQAVLLIVALFACWFAWQGGDPAERARIRRALGIGGIVGAVCFAAGYVGPIIFLPKASQGPLVGILITGPLGFILGSLAGFVWVKLIRAI